MTELDLPDNLAEFFPWPTLRDKQAKCLDFVRRMLLRDIRDIIISAPTGSGKSAIGTTLGLWAAQPEVHLPGQAGAYYLCTQKLLQDQIENDIPKFPLHLRNLVSLKSAGAYPCPTYGDCNHGLMQKPLCSSARSKPPSCAYLVQKQKYRAASVAITNYPYFFTEKTYNEHFTSRKLLIADECHSLETQLLRFAEIVVGPEEIERYTPTLRAVPACRDLGEFTAWLQTSYLRVLKSYDEALSINLDARRAREKKELELLIGRLLRTLADIQAESGNWVFWTEGQGENLRALAKPIGVAGYFQGLIDGASHARIYMSAYPGSKPVFCRSLGLDPNKTAMLSLGSVFHKERRPIHITTLGSMSRANLETTLPSLCRWLSRLLEAHPDQKGLVHCHSYALGSAISNFFKGSAHGSRVLFPQHASERESVYEFHRKSSQPSVIISPSFSEGFDFADEAARWQVIAKVPYPCLGDRQVVARKNQDPEWYALKTVMTLVQASGRICRSETDYGITYITDSDFESLWRNYSYLFPAWWVEALQWH